MLAKTAAGAAGWMRPISAITTLGLFGIWGRGIRLQARSGESPTDQSAQTPPPIRFDPV